MAQQYGSKPNLKFRCADVHQGCPWETSGSSEDEMMPRIEQHGREAHNLQTLDHETRNKVRRSIRRAAA